MKVRNGFVSNSSSSSFIVGIAKIKDYDKFQNYLRENSITLGYDVKVITFANMLKDGWDTKIIDDKIIVESFQTDARVSTNDLRGDELFFVVNKSNNEGDSAFSNDDGYWELDYDIDLSFFDSSDRSIYNAFFDEKSGLDLEKSDVSFGAGRNG